MTVTSSNEARNHLDQAAANCPACTGRRINALYKVQNIPVNSCLLVPTQAEALTFPCGNLDLVFCQDCGFIFNAGYDATQSTYSALYEETQGFSPTFNRFAKSLAQTLVTKHQLGGKTILEIGCGKGEFLSLLCELAQDSHGIGIDPGYVPDRNTSLAMPRMQFIVDWYDHRYAHLPSDFIVCRHTLEHIQWVDRFVNELRLTIGDRKSIQVFFELPDVLRELKEGAFWDIYYEHCSYFSCGSLARLFRRNRFDVTELERTYDDQYISLTAVPTDGQTEPHLAIENDLGEMQQLAINFPNMVQAAMEKWRRKVLDAHHAGRRSVIWGGGSKGVAFLTTLGLRDEIDYVVDINPFKQEKFMPRTGNRIVSPAFLKDFPPDLVIVMNPIYVKEIGKTLFDMGLTPDIVAV
jgi:SAM-dependent methyltransferase